MPSTVAQEKRERVRKQQEFEDSLTRSALFKHFLQLNDMDSLSQRVEKILGKHEDLTRLWLAGTPLQDLLQDAVILGQFLAEMGLKPVILLPALIKMMLGYNNPINSLFA